MSGLGTYWRNMFAWQPLPAALLTTTVVAALMVLAVLVVVTAID